MIHSELLLSCRPSHNFRVGPKHCCRQVLYRSRQCLPRLILCESNKQCDTTADRQPLLVSICLPEHSTRTNDRQNPTAMARHGGKCATGAGHAPARVLHIASGSTALDEPQRFNPVIKFKGPSRPCNPRPLIRTGPETQ